MRESDSAAPEPDRTAAASRADAPTLERGSVVGRYVVLDELGAGGMGVVFAAYDPELDRKVALKLLHAAVGSETASGGAARLLREARAMAKLSHPNVVAVHDVGEHGGRVFIAMEFVEGATLQRWLEAEHSWRRVVEVFVEAGRGLAAAHREGLVHRDFKPENVMVDGEGRVWVMDFGLVRSTAATDGEAKPILEDLPRLTRTPNANADETRDGTVLGTPAYMAPEQWSGRPTDGRTDQFSYCVALYEGLYRQRPFAGDTLAALAFAVTQGQVRAPSKGASVPDWLRPIVMRGLDARAEQRFGSMDELLDALQRGHGRARQRRILVGVAVAAAAAGAVVVGERQNRAARQAACEAMGVQIEQLWNADVRSRMREAIVATGLSYAETTAERVLVWLDRHTDAWRGDRTEACLAAEAGGTWDDTTRSRSEWCLEERRADVESRVQQLLQADERVVQRGVWVAATLPDTSPCIDPVALGRLPLPPTGAARTAVASVRAELAAAVALRTAGKWREAFEIARAARGRAEAIGWPPLVASLEGVEARLLSELGRYPEAETAAVEAYLQAAKVTDWNTAATAATSLVHIVGYREARHAEGRTWAGHAEVAASLAGDPLGLHEARRVIALAGVAQVSGAHDEAAELYGRAGEIYEQTLAPEHPLLARNLHNLANVHFALGQYDQAGALAERALESLEAALGPDHPDVASTLSVLGAIASEAKDYDGARRAFERALEIRKRALGDTHPQVAGSLANLARAQLGSGSRDAAKRTLERALAMTEDTLGSDHPQVASLLHNLSSIAQEDGELQRVKDIADRILKIIINTYGADHKYVARALHSLGEAHTALGACREALRAHERALAIRQATFERNDDRVAASLGYVGATHLALRAPSAARPLLERAVAIYDTHPGVQDLEPETRFALAKALVATGRAQARARSQAEQATLELRAQDDRDADLLAEVEAWIESQR